MSYLKPAAALLPLAIALSPISANAAVILNSSTVSLQTSASASVNGINNSDADQLIPSDTLLTDFHQKIFSFAEAYWYGGYYAYASALTTAEVDIDVAVGDAITLFNVTGLPAGDLNIIGGAPPATGTGEVTYTANFTLTSAYVFDMQVFLEVPGESTVRLQSADTVYYESSLDPSYWLNETVDGLLGPGSYELFATSYCPTPYCYSPFILDLQLTAVQPVPLPAALPLMAGGLVLLIAAAKRKT